MRGEGTASGLQFYSASLVLIVAEGRGQGRISNKKAEIVGIYIKNDDFIRRISYSVVNETVFYVLRTA